MSNVIGRPRDAELQYRMRLHTIGKYNYAGTPKLEVDPKTGKEIRRITHWGTIDENMVFHPNAAFLYLPLEERHRMIFPEEWDLSELKKLPSERKAGRPACEEDSSRFYGDIWLMEQIADQSGVVYDLLVSFGDNQEIVQDILSVAIFSYLTKLPYSHLKAWQKLGKFPSRRTLDPSVVTRLCQSITEENRQAFFRQRARRTRNDELCAVDSTTRRAYGRCLAEIRWGKNKDDDLTVPQTIEVIVWTLTRHEPIFYMSFGGNMSDKRTLPMIDRSLRQAGFTDVVLVTDRGYESPRNLDWCIAHHRKLIAAVIVRRKFILDKIREMGAFGAAPPGMEWLKEEEVFAVQYETEKELRGRGGRIVSSDRLRVNLYFDPRRRADEEVFLQKQIAEQESKLNAFAASGEPFADDNMKEFRFFRVTRDRQTHTVESFTLNETKVEQVRRPFGFFAILTHKLDMTAQKTLYSYSLRAEQEQGFTLLKTDEEASLQRCSSDLSMDGRRFIEFIGMILIARLTWGWRSSKVLRASFPYVFAMAEEMRCIRCIEHKGKQKMITPFVGKQVTICNEFNITIPKGCEPAYESPVMAPKRKRGRPRKNVLKS